MLKNYLKIALRNCLKHKSFTITNIAGLTVAFAATLLLALTAFYELSYDDFHKNGSSLYQLYRRHGGETTEGTSSFPIPFTPTLRQEVPGIARISRYADAPAEIVRYKDKELSVDIRTVDQDFLEMFSFPLIDGITQPRKALDDLNSIVLTRKAKNRIFGQEEAVGKTIELKIDTSWQPFTITAIAGDNPENSTITFGGLIRFENFDNYNKNKNDWDKNTHSVYAQLAPNTSRNSFEASLKNFTHAHYADDIKAIKRNGGSPDKDGEYMRIGALPLADFHFSAIAGASNSSKFYPYLLLLISGFILFIASVNFVNLSLGRAFSRTKEIGLRKVLGAVRKQILYQFWGEALLICIISLILGLVTARLLLPGYKTLFNQGISPAALTSPAFLLSIIGGFVFVSLLAGGYPAWILSALNTALSVKGKVTISKSNRLRNGLIVVQFVLSGLLIICTAVVWQQLSYMRKAPLGYNKEQVISIPIGSHIQGQRALDLMRSRLAGVPNVLSISATDINLGRGRDNSSSTSMITFDHKDRQVTTNWLRVDYDYLKTLDIKLVEGRDFNRSYAADTNGVLINEKMAAQLGEKDPIGKELAVGVSDNSHSHVIGVVKDFHFKSLHREIGALTMTIHPAWSIGYIFVKVAPGDLPGSMAAVDKVWRSINPAAESGISFLDENTDKLYRKEARLSGVFISGALLAIIVSCLGLFAIVVLVMGQRTREIGIRKVLGASTASIFNLVAREFMQLVLLALVIASPVAWYIMHNWLQDFAYRIQLGPWVFLFSAGVALVIALATVSYQAIRAASVNPVDNLKSE